MLTSMFTKWFEQGVMKLYEIKLLPIFGGSNLMQMVILRHFLATVHEVSVGVIFHQPLEQYSRSNGNILPAGAPFARMPVTTWSCFFLVGKPL